MASLAELPIVGDVRGCGYFRVAELVRDKETKETFSDEESEWLLRGVLSPILYDAGLICRADDRAGRPTHSGKRPGTGRCKGAGQDPGDRAHAIRGRGDREVDPDVHATEPPDLGRCRTGPIC